MDAGLFLDTLLFQEVIFSPPFAPDGAVDPAKEL